MLLPDWMHVTPYLTMNMQTSRRCLSFLLEVRTLAAQGDIRNPQFSLEEKVLLETEPRISEPRSGRSVDMEM